MKLCVSNNFLLVSLIIYVLLFISNLQCYFDSDTLCHDEKMHLALGVWDRGIGSLNKGALGPGEGALEALHQVNDAPCHDRVVVQRHIEGDGGGGQTNALQVRGHLVPASYRSFAQALSNGKLQIKQWNSFDRQHDCIWNQKSS